jgi:hypothetical protein
MATIVGCFAILVASTVPAAPVPEGNWEHGGWELVWAENFDSNPRLVGWDCRSFGSSTYIGVVRCGEGMNDNKCLLADGSHRSSGGAGYQIQSPSFEAMALDVTKPYMIAFSYSPAMGSWTFPLVSSFVSLAVKDCDNGCAKLGWVDEEYLCIRPLAFRPVAELPLHVPGHPMPPSSGWYDIEIVVMPSARLDQASFVIYVDSQLKAMGTRGLCAGYCGIAMVDLPGVPWDPASEEMPAVIQCCNSARWDNFAVYQLANEPEPPRDKPRGIDIHCDPNPFNPATRIQIELPKPGFTRLDIFDIAGRQVRTLCSEMREAGRHTLIWSGVDDSGASIASGAYLARVSSGGESATFRLTLVR